jgi:ATP-dependent DNA ligase
MIETSFPNLYKVMANGKTRIWSIEVEDTGKEAKVYSNYGILEGKIVRTEATIVSKGKNIGKSNETTYLEQALFEAKSKWVQKIKKEQYSPKENETLSNNIKSTKEEYKFRPMLAHTYTKKSSEPEYISQPKLDGIRMNVMNANGEMKFVSRTGKPIENFLDLKSIFIMNKIPENIILDGEFGCFGKKPIISFQEVTGIVKRKKGTLSSKEIYIDYVLYDLYDTNNPNMPFDLRWKLLEKIHKYITGGYKTNIKLCCKELVYVKTKEEIDNALESYLKEGYEGLMLRVPTGIYENDKRSKNLLKYKKFCDSEYKIVDFKEGRGNDSKTIIFVCETSEGKTFAARPAMTREKRTKMYETAIKDPKEFIGKMLTVKYFELSPDNIPRFPVGLAIRDYE